MKVKGEDEGEEWGEGLEGEEEGGEGGEALTPLRHGPGSDGEGVLQLVEELLGELLRGPDSALHVPKLGLEDGEEHDGTPHMRLVQPTSLELVREHFL